MHLIDFVCVKKIEKDLCNKNIEISNDMANILCILEEYFNTRRFDLQYNPPVALAIYMSGGPSIASCNILKKMKEKVKDRVKAGKVKLKGLGEVEVDSFGNVKIPRSFYTKSDIENEEIGNILIAYWNEIFYRDMVKINEDGLTENEKRINEKYKKDFEYIKERSTMWYKIRYGVDANMI